MYGREYGDKTLNFEPSGGLLHWALVMQDQETDTYWSIMTGDALAGEMQGMPLEELPLGEKVQFGEWVAAHPDTLVLSVDGKEHDESNPYENYFTSEEAPRGSEATDHRLPPKAPVYAFQRGGDAMAVPFDAFVGGGVFPLGEDRWIFLYRPKGAEIFHSTSAFVSAAGFEITEAGIVEKATGARFDPDAEGFVGGEGAVERLDGFDTFWFHWSMTHPESRLLGS